MCRLANSAKSLPNNWWSQEPLMRFRARFNNRACSWDRSTNTTGTVFNKITTSFQKRIQIAVKTIANFENKPCVPNFRMECIESYNL